MHGGLVTQDRRNRRKSHVATTFATRAQMLLRKLHKSITRDQFVREENLEG